MNVLPRPLILVCHSYDYCGSSSSCNLVVSLLHPKSKIGDACALGAYGVKVLVDDAWVLVKMGWSFLWPLLAFLAMVVVQGQEAGETPPPPLSAVMVTTKKDAEVFSLSIKSALRHLVDVETFYIVTPDADDLSAKMNSLGPRVKFVNEAQFNFTGDKVVDTMYNAVKNKGEYPLDNGKSQFERILYSKIGWFLQQLLKLYSGRVLNLDDFVLVDSDVIWYKDVKLIAENTKPLRTFYYASSTQYHPSYVSTMRNIAGVTPVKGEERPGVFKSGVVHHLPINKVVLDDLFRTAEEMHPGMEMWEILLTESAFEMTCRAPKGAVCGAGSTLSEYELYFAFARHKYPRTVHIRPLMWANGPMPGMIYTPDPTDDGPLLNSDAPKWKWTMVNHERSKTMFRQMAADKEAGFDFIGYHNYAKRRYFELAKDDIATLCSSVPAPYNTSCAYDQLKERPDRNVSNWFAGCSCFMAKNFWG